MRKITLFFLKGYKKIITPILELLFGNGCKFNPTCSEYSVVAIEKLGIIKGTLATMKRLSRCHPFSKHSYYDPI
jgi:putative membrane protein insertion efficiency factor